MGSPSEYTPCPLCRTADIRECCHDERRNFLQCPVCSLVFVPPRHFLPAEEEKKRYDLHRNGPDDPGYRRFLRRLFIPLHRRLAPGSSGLDFGSGPEPVLSRMFEEAGHSMTKYDRYYDADPAALERHYDFIAASEVVEHLHDPLQELERLWACLKPGGLLGIMTQPAVALDAFPRWYYKNDRTHVCFFSGATFVWLALRWKAGLSFPDSGVALFRKKKADRSAR